MQNILCTVPRPTVTISRSPSTSALFANLSVVTFTCQLSIHVNIDTPVTLSLTWTREVYSDEDDTTTEVIVVNSTTKEIQRRWTFNDFSSKDQRATCNGTISSAIAGLFKAIAVWMVTRYLLLVSCCFHSMIKS